jgi:hypothetical protein
VRELRRSASGAIVRRAKSKCAACGIATRRGTRHRTFVLSLGRVRPGFVCGSCARLGWLLVFGGDTAERPRSRKHRAEPVDPRQVSLLEDAPSAPTGRPRVSVEDAKAQLNPKRRTGARAGRS